MATKANVDRGLVDRLCAFLEHVGKPERQVAAQIGISPQALNHATKGKNYLGLDSLRSLVREYRLNINWLLTGEGAMFVGGPVAEAAKEGPVMRGRVGGFPGRMYTGIGEASQGHQVAEDIHKAPIDNETLSACIGAVEEILKENHQMMDPDKKAAVISALYDLCMEAETTPAAGAIKRLLGLAMG